MTAKHTAGPWHCSPEADLHRIGIYAGKGDDIIICDATDEDIERDGECEANARLIAASPDLLAALESVPITNNLESTLDFFNRYRKWLEIRRATIAKATQSPPEESTRLP